MRSLGKAIRRRLAVKFGMSDALRVARAIMELDDRQVAQLRRQAKYAPDPPSLVRDVVRAWYGR